MKKITLLCCLFTATILLDHGNLFSMDKIVKKYKSAAEYYHEKMRKYYGKIGRELVEKIKEKKGANTKFVKNSP